MKTLQSAAELVPVPLLRNLLGVAIKAIELCEVRISIFREYQTDQPYYLVVIGDDGH